MPDHRRRTLEAIHDSAVDSIITINEQGTIQTVNPATETMFGYQASELIGKNVNILMPNPLRDEHDNYLRNYLKTGVRKIIGIGREISAIKRDGSVFPIHLAVSEVKLGDGLVFAGFIRDLTELKLMQSRVMMNERLAAIGQMVSGLAHETRNAFQRSHACLAELALDLDNMPNSLSLLNKVQRALDDVHWLLEEVRSYSAPIILQRRPRSIALLTQEAWQNLVDTNPSSIALPKFALEQEPDFPESCMIDDDRIKLVIRNLLENAFFACRKPGQILVRLKFENSDQPLVRIEVIDNGEGVAELDQETIFNPFYTTKTKGTGLGLAVSRRYVEAHEGRIYVERADNGGACFVILLPIHSHSTRK
jgi:PAS domain S-box-containing protein